MKMSEAVSNSEHLHSATKQTNNTCKPTISYAKPLYYISLLNAMSCPIDFNNYCARSGIFHKIYSCFLIALIICASGLSWRGRMNTSYHFLIQTVIITEAIQQALLLVSNVFGIIKVITCGEFNIQSYFRMMKKIDQHLVTTMNLTKKKIVYYSLLFLSHLALVLLCIFDYWTWTSSLGIHIWMNYCFRLYSYYLCLILVLQIYTFATAVKVRFEILNERLFDVSIHWIGNIQSHQAIAIRDLFFSYKKISVQVDASGLSLECLIKMHDLLCDIIELLNNSFGFNIVLLVCNIIINSVIAFNLTLIFGTGVQEAKDDDYSLHVITLNVLWALLFVAMGICVARACDDASKEARRTATIAFKLLACIPCESNLAKERETRLLLSQLAMQIEHRKPEFDACGFFPVNHSMLYAIIGAITSYIVIIIQFNNSPIMISARNGTNV